MAKKDRRVKGRVYVGAYQILGFTVRRLRRQRVCLTQEELAERAGLSSPAISRIERGETDMSFTMLLRIADGLSMSVPDLLGEYKAERLALGCYLKALGASLVQSGDYGFTWKVAEPVAVWLQENPCRAYPRGKR